MTQIVNSHPEMYDEATDVNRLNGLLTAITAKRFLSPLVFCQAVRAALDIHGIVLPHVEIEGANGPTGEESPSILHRATDPLDPIMYAAPDEGEYFFHIEDAEGNFGELYLYMVCDKDKEGVYECYAQVITDDEYDSIVNIVHHRLYPEIEKNTTFIDDTRIARGDTIQDQDDTPPET